MPIRRTFSTVPTAASPPRRRCMARYTAPTTRAGRGAGAATPAAARKAPTTTRRSPGTVHGAIHGADDQGVARLWFGDTGVSANVTDNYKFKLGYETGAWATLLNVAYEDRAASALSPNTYLRNAAGTRVWSGTVEQGGASFNVPASSLGVNVLARDSLNLGLRVQGELSDTVSLEANLNTFDVLRDQTRASFANPAAPGYDGRGQVTDYGDTGWRSAEAKLRFVDAFGREGLNLVSGVRHDSYELNLDVFDSSDWANGAKSAYSSRSGGATAIDAAFAQFDWNPGDRWSLALGGRWESFASRGGHYSADDPATPAFELVRVPGRRVTRFSPKFSLG